MMRIWQRGEQWVRQEWWWLSYLGIFTLVFLLLLSFQLSPVFADPDSFYHAKMAILLRDQGIIKSFPWLDLTVLGENYTNQHFLYHLLLIPFITVFPPLMGLKLATVTFGAVLAVVLYWTLRQFNVRWPFLVILILFLIRPFTFRISLAKAPSTSMIFLFLGMVWIFQYQFRKLFVLAFTYVWYYGGFPLLGVVASMYAGVSTLYNRVHRRMHSHRYVHNVLALVRRAWRRPKTINPNLKVLGIVVLGLGAGVVIHPYFPNNLTYYYHQLINIGVINFRSVIGVGAEWYGYNVLDLLANGAFASLLLVLALAAYIFRFRTQSKQSWTLLVLTIFFFLLTIKSRRYVEYYIPVAVVFSAVAISDALCHGGEATLLREIRAMLHGARWKRALAWVLAIYLLFGSGYVAARDYVNERNDLRNGFSFTKFQAASAWLAANTPAGSRVVHSDWDEFPVLFYHNTHNTYIVGLDPTFLYKADEETYWTWVNITLGKYEGDVHEAVTKKLGARYVFIADNHDVMTQLIERSGKFTERYADAEAVIYEAQ